MKKIFYYVLFVLCTILFVSCKKDNWEVTDFSTDPYVNVTSEFFYEHYTPSKCYEDTVYRTQHHFMSGDISDEGRYYLPKENNYRSTDTSDYMVSDLNYTYRNDGSYESYTINSLDGSSQTIYYGGAYVSLNEVAAYLYAFGEVPPNSKYLSSEGGESVAAWGKYGRSNNASYSNNIFKFPYEPLMPEYTDSHEKVAYIETDFGTTGGYKVNNKMQSEYNNGKYITRGCGRFVFVCNQENALDRHVFYTYNHYNDFQEYLNYKDGFGHRFGNETGGGVYNDKENPSPTPYVKATYTTLEKLKQLF